MSHTRALSDILLVSIAVFILFVVAAIDSEPAGGSDRPAGVGPLDTAYLIAE